MYDLSSLIKKTFLFKDDFILWADKIDWLIGFILLFNYKLLLFCKRQENIFNIGCRQYPTKKSRYKEIKKEEKKHPTSFLRDYHKSLLI